jgi:hypothetical protein
LNGDGRDDLVILLPKDPALILLAKSDAPGFTDPAKPKWLIATGSESDNRDNQSGGGNRAFRHNILNMTIDVGNGNPGAIGIDFIANNRGSIDGVTIRSGKDSGKTAINLTRSWPGPAMVLDASIEGFDHAMELDPHFLEGGHHHHHDDGVTSIGIEADGDCDGKKLNDWLSTVVREQGADIFRMKGIFALSGNPDRVIFQGVHMLIDAANGGPWASRPRKNSLVFIGRNLDRKALESGFRSCLA